MGLDRNTLSPLALGLALLLGHPASAETASKAAEEQPASLETLAEADADGEAAKAGDLCNIGGYHCSGRWADLVDHLFTNGSGSVQIYVSPTLEAELNAKGFCALASGKFILLKDYDGGEQVVLSQLYLSYAMNSRFALRLQVDATTGECYLGYARTLYNEP